MSSSKSYNYIPIEEKKKLYTVCLEKLQQAAKQGLVQVLDPVKCSGQI